MGCAQEFRCALIRDEKHGRHSNGDAKKAFGFKGSLLKREDWAGAMALGKVILEMVLKSSGTDETTSGQRKRKKAQNMAQRNFNI